MTEDTAPYDDAPFDGTPRGDTPAHADAARAARITSPGRTLLLWCQTLV